MTNVFSLIAALALSFLLNAAIYSEDKNSEDKKPHAVRGVIASIEGVTITIEVKSGNTKVFTANDETAYDIDGNKGDLTDLKKGMYIYLQNTKDVAVKVWVSETNKRVGSGG